MVVRRHPGTGERGFSLVETIVAMAILATALLSLAAVFALGLRQMGASTPGLIAREKAREAVESVHTARDTRLITWAQINNVENGGVFVSDAQPMYKPGKDGLVNTADDGLYATSTRELEETIQPGADGQLGTADDIRTPLATYTRQIEITNIMDGAQVNPTLRQLKVTVRYRIGKAGGDTGGEIKQYVLTTYISSIS
jgi:prepilin-type N-terminal cleavage/methylation domain-containing protein